MENDNNQDLNLQHGSTKPMLSAVSEMTTDEMLSEIVTYNYESYGFPYVFLDFSYQTKLWEVTWRNPKNFKNSSFDIFEPTPRSNAKGKTPKEACKRAMKFILENPNLFKKR